MLFIQCIFSFNMVLVKSWLSSASNGQNKKMLITSELTDANFLKNYRWCQAHVLKLNAIYDELVSEFSSHIKSVGTQDDGTDGVKDRKCDSSRTPAFQYRSLIIWKSWLEPKLKAWVIFSKATPLYKIYIIV